jgi:hypothetical protein
MVHEASSQIINIQCILYQWSTPDFRGLTHKSDIVIGLVGVENNILVMEERHCLEVFKV